MKQSLSAPKDIYNDLKISRRHSCTFTKVAQVMLTHLFAKLMTSSGLAAPVRGALAAVEVAAPLWWALAVEPSCLLFALSTS